MKENVENNILDLFQDLMSEIGKIMKEFEMENKKRFFLLRRLDFVKTVNGKPFKEILISSWFYNYTHFRIFSSFDIQIISLSLLS